VQKGLEASNPRVYLDGEASFLPFLPVLHLLGRFSEGDLSPSTSLPKVHI